MGCRVSCLVSQVGPPFPVLLGWMCPSRPCLFLFVKVPTYGDWEEPEYFNIVYVYSHYFLFFIFYFILLFVRFLITASCKITHHVILTHIHTFIKPLQANVMLSFYLLSLYMSLYYASICIKVILILILIIKVILILIILIILSQSLYLYFYAYINIRGR